MAHLYMGCVRSLGSTPVCLCRPIAVHEAGHTIACLELGVRLCRVDLRSRACRNGWGYVEHEVPRTQRADLLIALAGPEAQRVVQQGPDHDGLCDGDEAYVAARATPADVTTLRSTARALVLARWLDVERVAEELTRKPLLFGAQVRAMLATRAP